MSNLLDIDLSEVAAIGSFLVSIFAVYTANKSQNDFKRLEEENAKRIEKQLSFEKKSWADEYFKEVTNWSTDVCDTLTDAIHICESEQIDEAELRKIRSKLSSFVDTGRWYFPNLWQDKYGKQKPPAYRGLRQPVLEHIIAPYRILSDLPKYKYPTKLIVSHKRHFVSLIQEIIDPRKRNLEIKNILDSFEGSEKMRN